jgi:hypothetical protein
VLSSTVILRFDPGNRLCSYLGISLFLLKFCRTVARSVVLLEDFYSSARWDVLPVGREVTISVSCDVIMTLVVEHTLRLGAHPQFVRKGTLAVRESCHDISYTGHKEEWRSICYEAIYELSPRSSGKTLKCVKHQSSLRPPQWLHTPLLIPKHFNPVNIGEFPLVWAPGICG